MPGRECSPLEDRRSEHRAHLVMHAYGVVERGRERVGRLVIVCGLPGSGKSTIAKQLESELGAVRLCPDDWMEELGIDLFDGKVRARIEDLQWSLARRLLELQQVVVIEWGTWARAERDALREGARALGAAVELRVLDDTVEVLWERVRRRGFEQRVGSRALTRADLESYDTTFQRPTEDELRLYDPPLGGKIPPRRLRAAVGSADARDRLISRRRA